MPRKYLRDYIQKLARSLTISDLVNQDISTAGGRASLYNWIVYEQEYKARERKGEEQ